MGTISKNAGMKYIIITAKHHDGFAMFKSNASNYNIVDFTPYGKDVLDGLAKACRKHKMKLGFYYSQAQDWNNPGGLHTEDLWNKAGQTLMRKRLMLILRLITAVGTRYNKHVQWKNIQIV